MVGDPEVFVLLAQLPPQSWCLLELKAGYREAGHADFTRLWLPCGLALGWWSGSHPTYRPVRAPAELEGAWVPQLTPPSPLSAWRYQDPSCQRLSMGFSGAALRRGKKRLELGDLCFLG